MLHQPTSPNVFNQIYLSNHKQEREDNFSQSQLIFNTKLETIEEFIDLLKDNPHNLAQLNLVQLKWEVNFYQHQLKAALSLNYSLIKLHYQQNEQLKHLKQQIDAFSNTRKESKPKTQIIYQCMENVMDYSNSATLMKKKVMKEAFQAQKKIIQAKYRLQCEQLKKVLQHRQCVLKATKQQNQYLRSQLIKMGQKHKNLSKLNKDFQERRKKWQQESKRMNMVMRQLQQNEKKWMQQKRLNQVNCSPIRRSGQTFTMQQGEISFNIECYQQHMLQNKILKKQLQDLQASLDKLKVKQVDQHQKQHQEVMKESRIMFLTSLQAEYLQLKQQLQLRLVENQKYKQIVRQIKEQYRLQTQKNTQKECNNCNSLKKANEALKEQNQKIELKYLQLRQKLQKTLNLQLLQRRQWEALLKDLN